MDEQYINITLDNVSSQHLCCAIADQKHQVGVMEKREWLKTQIPQGHVFRKLDAKGKVFIEYAPLETAWVPIMGDHYIYIHCLWVSGSFKGKGHGRSLLEYCINDAKAQGKSGVCILSAAKKKPFLAEKKFMIHYGFKVVDKFDDYELLALSFDGSNPYFPESVKQKKIHSNQLIIYYGKQCPYIPNCIQQIEHYCNTHQVPFELLPIDSLEKAKSVPCIFNNWAVFYKGELQTVHLLNEGYLKKLLGD